MSSHSPHAASDIQQLSEMFNCLQDLSHLHKTLDQKVLNLFLFENDNEFPAIEEDSAAIVEVYQKLKSLLRVKADDMDHCNVEK